MEISKERGAKRICEASSGSDLVPKLRYQFLIYSGHEEIRAIDSPSFKQRKLLIQISGMAVGGS
ncbi:hypothetical protein V6Z11_A13G262100 [Gossypium hirsutum]